MGASVYGARLKQLREARDMHQITLAKRTGVAQSYISALETGKKANPGLAIFERLAVGLGMPLGTLLGVTPGARRTPLASLPQRPRDNSPAAQQAALAQALARAQEMP